MSTPAHTQGTLSVVHGPCLPSSIWVHLLQTGLDLFWWLICLIYRLMCCGYKREEINDSSSSPVLQDLHWDRRVDLASCWDTHSSSLWLRSGCPGWRESGSAVSASLPTHKVKGGGKWQQNQAGEHVPIRTGKFRYGLLSCKLKSIQIKAHSNVWKL